MDLINQRLLLDNLNKKEKIITKKYKMKDVFDKNTYPKNKANKVISIVKKKV
jgi:hypothetical protein